MWISPARASILPSRSSANPHHRHHCQQPAGHALIIIGAEHIPHQNLKVRAVSRRRVVAEFLVETAQNFVNGNMGEKFAILHGPFVAALSHRRCFSSLLSLVGMFPRERPFHRWRER